MEKVLQVNGLRKTYHDHTAVDNLTLTVGRGEILGLLGPNGAGKTTSLECVLGVRRRDAGSVALLGMDPARDRRKVFERVGVQFQDGVHPPKIRVKELCTVTQALYQNPVDWHQLATRFGLQPLLNRAVGELSGGEKQRLNVLLALLPNPEIVFLDELTTGLDTKARREVWETLKAWKAEGLTAVLTSHFMDEVEALCDRIVILNHGKTVAQGTVAEVVSASGTTTLEDAYLHFTEEESHESL